MTLVSETDPSTGRPVGKQINAWPASPPGDVRLLGDYGHIEKLNVAFHAADLWEAFRGDETLWPYMGYGPFAEETAFQDWLAERQTLTDPFYYAILDAKRRAVGVFTLMEIRPSHRVIEVGHVVYGPQLQRTPLATEAQFLLARYVFETLGYRRYEWKCNALNAPSRQAAERYGFTFEGIFRQHQIIKGRNRDTAWYSMLDSEWPSRKAAFQRWLAADNFDAEGRQRQSLSALRER